MIAKGSLAEASDVPQVSNDITTEGKKAKTMRPILVASASSPSDTCIILDSVNGIFDLCLMWDTSTPKNKNNPNGGSFIDHAYGITCEELDRRAFQKPSVLRQGKNWKLDAEVCDVFTNFVFIPEHGESVTLCVSMAILRSMECAISMECPFCKEYVFD